MQGCDVWHTLRRQQQMPFVVSVLWPVRLRRQRLQCHCHFAGTAPASSTPTLFPLTFLTCRELEKQQINIPTVCRGYPQICVSVCVLYELKPRQSSCAFSLFSGLCCETKEKNPKPNMKCKVFAAKHKSSLVSFADRIRMERSTRIATLRMPIILCG